jgi:sulfate/thiosulfate transport system ATP-binding protein
VSIRLSGIRKNYGDFVALGGVDLEIDDGELIALLGPSGSGKTTLLRVIAGLEKPDSGSVTVNGADNSTRSFRDREVGFVFQHYALFRHMTVFENVAFGLRVRPRRSRPAEREIASRVHELLKLVQLDFLADRYPSQLSGGQRQRVALARTLAVEPKVLLLDEPFGALDAKVRRELRQWLRRLHEQIRVTSVFVTHDQDEALELGNRVVVMNSGRIEQVGTPDQVYHHPANPFVHHFLGSVNLFHGRVEKGKLYIGDTEMEMDATHGHAHDDNHGGDNRKAVLAVRPHMLEILLTPNGGGEFSATVLNVNPAGPQVKVELVTAWGDPVQVEMGHERFRILSLVPGKAVFIRPKDEKLFVYQI